MSKSAINQRYALMSLSRFEAFSDGVFVIAATLLALEIRVADLSNATAQEVWRELLHLFPHVISYATSFIVIGVLWLNHHALFHFDERVDRVSLTINYPICYFLSALLALVNSRLSLVLYAAISLFYLLPGVIDRQLTRFDRELGQEEAKES